MLPTLAFASSNDKDSVNSAAADVASSVGATVPGRPADDSTSESDSTTASTSEPTTSSTTEDATDDDAYGVGATVPGRPADESTSDPDAADAAATPAPATGEQSTNPPAPSDPVDDLLAKAAAPLKKAASVLATPSPGITGELTVTFKVDGSTYKEVTVAKNQAAPAVPDPTAAGKVFTGWVYTDTTDPLDPQERAFVHSGLAGATIITADLTVNATFTDSTHKVYFMSADPADDTKLSKAYVLYTAEVADGDKTSAGVVDFPDGLVPDGHVFADDWRAQGAGANFDFTTPITQNVTLIPQFVLGHRVWFNSGGTPVEPQVVVNGNKVQEPNPAPTRVGYTNPVWYDNADFNGSPFDFDTVITSGTAPTTLYAKWTGTEVPYSVVYWLEKPNIPLNENSAAGGFTEAQKQDANNFIFAYRDDSKKATAGSSVSVSATQANKDNAAAANNAIISLLGATDYSTLNLYSYSHSEDKVIAGNGTTVVNVYFTRNVWTFNINVDSYPSGYSSANAYLVMKVNGQTLTGATINYPLFTKIGLVNGAIGPTIVDDATGAPSVYCVSNTTGQPIDTYFSGWAPIGIWEFQLETVASQISLSNRYVNTSCTATFYPRDWRANMTVTRPIYFVESLDQTSPAADAPSPDYAALTERATRIKITTLQKYPDGKGNDAGLVSYSIPNGKQIFDIYTYGTAYTASYRDRQVTGVITGFLPTYLGGWYTNSNTNNGNCFQWEGTPGDGLFYQLGGGNVNRNDSLRYYILARASYSLTFDSQGGSSVSGYSGEDAILYQKPLNAYEPADPTKGNDLFLGWFEKPTDIQPFDFATTMPANNVHLYAKWLETPRDVTFYADPSGSVEVTDFAAKVANGGFISDPGVLNPTDWGRDSTDVFLGWYQKTSGGALVPYSWDLPVVGDLKLYAKWNPPYTPHHITYDAAGGGTAPTDATGYASGAKVVIADGSTLSKDGGRQIFIGWRTAGNDMLYRTGSIYVIDGADVTFVAQYAPQTNVATITFKQNASTSDDKVESWSAHHGATVTYPDAEDLKFTKTGHTFAGWHTLANATVAHAAYAPQSSATVSGTTTLFAVWAANVHKVSYQVVGAVPAGAPSAPAAAEVAYGTNVKVAPALSFAGYTFSGWSAPGISGSQFSMPDKDVVFSGKWTIIDYTIKYLPGAHGTFSAKTVTAHFGDNTPLAPLVTAQSGWEFTGWSPVPSAKVTGDATYTAQWRAVADPPREPEPDTYSVTYEAGGDNVTGLPAGVADLEANATYTVADGVPVREGYKFAGWTSSIGGTVQAGENFTMPAADVTLTAQWEVEEVITTPPTPETPETPEAPVVQMADPVNDVVAAAQNQGIPVMDIFGGQIPLMQPEGTNSWSLFDLIATLLAIAAAIVAGGYSVVRSRRKDDGDGEIKTTKRVFLIISAIVVLVAIVLFFVTQDITNPIVLFDRWSIVFFALLLATIVFARLAFSKKRRDDNDSDSNRNLNVEPTTSVAPQAV